MPIRTLVVDDSVFLRRTLPRLLETDPSIEVVGTAANGQEAIAKAKELRPDVITLDIVMPVMDGLTALKHIMREVPTPVVVVSSVTHEGARETVEALAAGAIDFVTKPSGSVSLDIARVKSRLVAKIKLAGRAKALRVADIDATSERFRKIAAGLYDNGKPSAPLPRLSASGQGAFQAPFEGPKHKILAIAASTGGPAALQAVLGRLDAGLSPGVVIVQHIDGAFSSALAERLNEVSGMHVRLCQEQDEILPGTALLAPGGSHMVVVSSGRKHFARLQREPADTLYRPSADVLFTSVATTCGAGACAVILTGMGQDGAAGIKDIRERGGKTIAQDEATCVIYGMPRVAVANGGIDIVSPLERIPAEIEKALNPRFDTGEPTAVGSQSAEEEAK